ncbi:fimbrial protein [Serratia fonticola]|uniref:Type 1 fimbrial protein n=1 Tax=Serratia fonticola TaxID=47917 RepID=A0AAE7EHP0_SERFO|nr:fimbrial protein [Serratia fonticola]QKJ58869.2 type 1 fimbrial protein [Serratia fonticola]
MHETECGLNRFETNKGTIILMKYRQPYSEMIKRARLILLSLILMYSGIGNALACGSSTGANMTPASATLNLNGPADRNNMVGTLITGWSTPVTAILNGTGCPTPSGYSTWGVATNAPIMTVNSYPVYPTEVPGIGYFVQVKDPNLAGQALVQNPTKPLWNSASMGAPYVGVTAYVAFVVTGSLQPGVYNLVSRKVGDGWLSTNTYSNNKALSAELYYNGVTITVTGSTCAINSGDENKMVTLPAVSTSGFQGIGSTSSENQSFTIGLNCQAGIALYATMTDITAPGNTSNVLSLAGSSTADGVGLQIFANGATTPVSFGPASSAKGNLNQWYVGGSSSSVATNYTIPFIAQYVKTATTLVPGTVNAVSTIIFSYQ